MASADRPETDVAPRVIRLHYGTDEDSANDILGHGLNGGNAAVFNVTGEFWTTTDPAAADTFAQVNPAGGTPARYSFDLPLGVLRALLASNPPRVYQHGGDWYEFLPTSYATVNQHRTNQQVISPVP
jgi:hypothetical protein